MSLSSSTAGRRGELGDRRSIARTGFSCKILRPDRVEGVDRAFSVASAGVSAVLGVGLATGGGVGLTLGVSVGRGLAGGVGVKRGVAVARGDAVGLSVGLAGTGEGSRNGVPSGLPGSTRGGGVDGKGVAGSGVSSGVTLGDGVGTGGAVSNPFPIGVGTASTGELRRMGAAASCAGSKGAVAKPQPRSKKKVVQRFITISVRQSWRGC